MPPTPHCGPSRCTQGSGASSARIANCQFVQFANSTVSGTGRRQRNEIERIKSCVTHNTSCLCCGHALHPINHSWEGCGPRNAVRNVWSHRIMPMAALALSGSRSIVVLESIGRRTLLGETLHGEVVGICGAWWLHMGTRLAVFAAFHISGTKRET